VACLLALAGCATRTVDPAVKSAGEIPALAARLARDSSDQQAWTRLGVAYLQVGRAQDARPLLETALARRSSDPVAMLHLGLTYEALQRYADARRLYEGYLAVGRSRELRRDLTQRLALLRRRELEALVKQAVAGETASGAPIRERSVAVFPFHVLQTDPTLRPLGRALAELLVVDLSQTSRLTVLERVQVQLLLDELKLSASSLVDPGTAVRSGRMLGAEQIVQGSLGGQSESLELNAAIVRVREATGAGSGMRGAPLSETDALNRVIDAEKRLALRIYQSLGIELTIAERERVGRRPTENLRAILAYGLGLEAYDAGDYARAAREFATAARLDPGFAAAREKEGQARATEAAAATSTAQLVEKAGIEASPPGAGASEILLPAPFTRDPVAEVLGSESVNRKTIIELIFRRPN
jgi:TolB-like protein/Tfp pilus assembly protein PilF